MALAILAGQSAAPAAAQDPAPPPLTERAPVMLDGRTLFEVGEAGTWSAAQRAAGISAALGAAAAGSEPVHLELAEHDGYPTLRMGAWHLVTVADSDVPMGVDAGEQAQRWQQIIEAALARAQRERSPAERLAAAGRAAAIVGLAALLHGLVLFIRRHLPGALARRLGWSTRSPLGGPPTWQSAFVLLCLMTQGAIWIAALWRAAGCFPAVRQVRWTALALIHRSLAAPLFTLGDRQVSSLDLLALLLAVGALWGAAGLLTRLFSVRLMRATGATGGALQPIATLARYGLVFIGTLVILQLFGINLSSLALLASVLGVGIGFGLQSIANNFVSGLIISFEQPVKPGDFVSLGDLHGTVLRVGARSTVVQTLDRVSIIVPNSKVLETEVVNWSYSDPVSRLHIPVGVAYGSDVAAVHRALLGAARAHPAVLPDPRPEVRFERFGESALDFELLVWSADPPGQSLLRSDLNHRIEANLRQAGIEIPFPQRTLHVPAPELAAIAASLRGEAPPAAVPHRPPVVEDGAPQPDGAGWQPVDLDALERRMRGPGGISVADRRHRLTTYRRCFVGSEAVDWLSLTYEIGRAEAVRLGQSLLERGVVQHVLNEQPFRDGNFFYRFTAEAEGSTELTHRAPAVGARRSP
ncbi:MAG: mechanosensitive ion channel [Deltaproteobacteria bacterium]|nr:mechanosensitive ion channel [Deltaproteobacteria bacterium]